MEYRDPVQEEWEKFQKAIWSEVEQSQQIIQEKQEEATAERQLDEIDEQMKNCTRCVSLSLSLSLTVAEKQLEMSLTLSLNRCQVCR